MMSHPVGLWRVEEQCGVAWNEAVKMLNTYCICITMLMEKNMLFLLWDQSCPVRGLNYTAHAVILNFGNFLWICENVIIKAENLLLLEGRLSSQPRISQIQLNKHMLNPGKNIKYNKESDLMIKCLN